MGRGLSILSVVISMVTGVVIVIGVMLLFPQVGAYIMDGMRGGEKVAEGPEPRSAAEVDARIDELEQNAEKLLEQTQAAQVLKTSTAAVTVAQPTQTAAIETSPHPLDQQALDDIGRREERRRAAMESPIGESLFTVESIWAQSRAAEVAIAEENKTGQTIAPAGSEVFELAQDVLDGTIQSTSLITLPQTGQGQLLAAGSVIPASLINDIRSDLPGLIRGQVTNDVYDTLTGAHVVIPRGSMLLGSYGDDAAQGQKRLFIYWTRLLFPDGTSVDLQKAGGVDGAGASGLKGRRRTGFVTALLGGALLNLVQNAGRQNTTSSDLASAARAATQASVGTVADRYLESALSRGPSFAVKAGTILNVQIEQDYYLAGRRPE